MTTKTAATGADQGAKSPSTDPKDKNAEAAARESALKKWKAPEGFQFSTQASTNLITMAALRERQVIIHVRAKNALTQATKNLAETDSEIAAAILREDPTGTLYESIDE